MYDISLQIRHQKYLFPLVFRTISAARILFSIACSQIKAGDTIQKMVTLQQKKAESTCLISTYCLIRVIKSRWTCFMANITY